VEAAHATDLTSRRSVTGLVFTLCGAAVCYKSKLQPTVATSSTEAEFIAAVMAAKLARYLRSILLEIGCPQTAPTVLYADNQAAILMVNANRPTTRSRHIDIQHFAIQEWREKGDILMEYIAGIINMSDALTKALGWTLHHRHTRRMMGHFAPGYSIPLLPASPTSVSGDASCLLSQEAGEGVGAQIGSPCADSPDSTVPNGLAPSGTQAVPSTAVDIRSPWHLETPSATSSGSHSESQDSDLSSQSQGSHSIAEHPSFRPESP
jgi:hypothetical protein